MIRPFQKMERVQRSSARAWRKRRRVDTQFWISNTIFHLSQSGCSTLCVHNIITLNTHSRAHSLTAAKGHCTRQGQKRSSPLPRTITLQRGSPYFPACSAAARWKKNPLALYEIHGCLSDAILIQWERIYGAKTRKLPQTAVKWKFTTKLLLAKLYTLFELKTSKR